MSADHLQDAVARLVDLVGGCVGRLGDSLESSLGGGRTGVAKLVHVSLQTVIVLCGVCAVGTVVLDRLGVGLEMGAEHGQVDAGVLALATLERLAAQMVAQMVLQMVFVLGDERAFGALEQLFRLDVGGALMQPVVLFVQTREDALLALEHLGRGGLMRV